MCSVIYTQGSLPSYAGPITINWDPKGSVRSGQESYAQAQKGMPLPSLPGESLARQIPTSGIKQVRPALPSTRLASLRASATALRSARRAYHSSIALPWTRLASLRAYGAPVGSHPCGSYIYLLPILSRARAGPRCQTPAPARREQGASRARARREQARRARAHNVARVRCAASPRALCARRARGTTRCARQLRRARAPPVQAIWPGPPNG